MSDQRGFTLVEMLVTIFVTMLVIVIPLAWIVISDQKTNIATSRALSATQAETGLQALTRDLREAAQPSTFTWSSTSASASLSIPTPGSPTTLETVTWSCSFSGGSCTRTVGSGGSAIPEIKNVVSLSFAPTDAGGNSQTSPASNPAYVGITLEVQNASSLNRTANSPESSKPITLADGAYLANTTS